MDQLKEIIWLSRIYKSKARKRLIGTTPLCKKDFERVSFAPENSKEFSDWFDKLIKEGVFLFYDKIEKKNGLTNGYIFTDKSIDTYIENNTQLKEFYDILENFFNRDVIV